MELVDVLGSLFGSVWKFFTDVNVPGLNIPYSALLVAVILIRLSVALVSNGLGAGRGTGTRSGSSRHVKISEKRKGDEY